MRDAMTQIAELMGNGYTLRLQRNQKTGACSADLSRGLWPFKKHVYIALDRQEFESAKTLLGANLKRRVRLLRESDDR
jgi:hypothetical protein